MAQLTQNLFGNSLTEIQDKARVAQGKRRREAGLLARQNSNRPGIDQALSSIAYQIGSSMFGGGKGSKEDMAKATEGEKETLRVRAMDKAGTARSAMETAQELFRLGLTDEASKYMGIAKVRASLKPTSSYETWYSADGSSQQVQEIGGIPQRGGVGVDPTVMGSQEGLFKEKPTAKGDGTLFSKDFTLDVNFKTSQRDTIKSQLANDKLLKASWYTQDATEAERAIIGEQLVGRVQGIAEQLKLRKYNEVYDAYIRNPTNQNLVKARRAMAVGSYAWSDKATTLYIEGGGINFDVNSDGVNVNQAPLPLEVLEANMVENEERQRVTRATNAEWDGLEVGNSAAESSEMNISKFKRPEAEDLLLAVASGQASPEEAVAGMEAKGYTFVSDKHRADQMILMQKIKDTPEMSQLYFEEGVTTKVRDNNIDKYISELEKKGNIQGQLNALKLRQYFKRLQDKVTTPVGLGRGGKTIGIKGTSFWDSAPSTYSGKGTIKNNSGN